MAVLFTVAIVGVGVALVGNAAAAELANETATFGDSNDTVAVDLSWNSSISDAQNTTADIVFYNATEYQNDSSTATVVHSETVTSDPGNTTTHNYTTADVSALEVNTEYVVAVEGTDSDLDDVAISTLGSSGSGFFAGSSGGAKLAGAGLLIAAAALMLRED